MRWEVRVLILGLVVLGAAVLLSGCGGSNDQTVYQNVYDRVTWNPAGVRLAFESVGGNGLFYLYSINNGGGSLVLLTPQDNDTDLTDEGGKMPSWSPNAAVNEMVMVGRRGTGGQALYLVNPVNVQANPVLKLTDDTALGADSHPSWSPDGAKIVYISNKGGAGRWTIWTVNRDATGAAQLYDPGAGNDAQWPVFSPDGTKIAFQLGDGDVRDDTSICVIDANGTNPVIFGAGNGFRDEAPTWSPDGALLAFHSQPRRRLRHLDHEFHHRRWGGAANQRRPFRRLPGLERHRQPHRLHPRPRGLDNGSQRHRPEAAHPALLSSHYERRQADPSRRTP